MNGSTHGEIIVEVIKPLVLERIPVRKLHATITSQTAVIPSDTNCRPRGANPFDDSNPKRRYVRRYAHDDSPMLALARPAYVDELPL